jgi:disulfide oxidoreductase YuzD
MGKSARKIKWQADVETHDYAAADSFLRLLYPPATVNRLVAGLRAARIERFKAKDIFRASRLSLLGVSNGHVESDREKIKDREKLSPLLLVRDPARGAVVIADGYHRLCAVYSFDEDAWIQCKIV